MAQGASKESVKDVIEKVPDIERKVSYADFEIEREKAFFSEREVRMQHRKLTEKGKEYRRDILAQKRQRAYFALNKHIKSIYESFQTESEVVDLKCLEALKDTLDKLTEEFMESHKTLHELFDNDEEKQQSYIWFDIRDRETMECRLRLTERIRGLEKQSAPEIPTSCCSKGSKSSSVSSRSSARSRRLDAAAKAAKLRVEADYLDTLFDKEREMKRLQLQRDLAVSEAEERIYRSLKEEENADRIDSTLEKEKFSFPSSMPISTIPTEIEDEKKPVTNISPPIFKSKMSTFTATSNPVLLQKSEQQESLIPSQFSKTNNSQRGASRLEPMNEMVTQLIEIQNKQMELTALLANQQRFNHLPVKEPPIFNGNPYEYFSIVSAFDSIISDNVISDKDRLYYLAKYTSGKANDIVKRFLAVNSERGYREARKLLDQRFGNPVYIAEAFKSRLKNWVQIKEGDSAGLQTFSDFLVSCKEAVEAVGSLCELDSNQIFVQIASKLPSYSGIRWCHYAHDAQLKLGFPLRFNDLVKFVKEESDLANDPVFSPDVLKRERKNNAIERTDKRSIEKGYNKSTKVSSFATGTSQDMQYQEQSRSYSRTHREDSMCPLCEKPHSILECFTFKRKTLEQRREVIRSKNLCFGCLKSGHISANCKSRLTCKECNKLHPTLLHGSIPNKNAPQKNGSEPLCQQTQKTSSSNNAAPPEESATTNVNVCNSTSASSGMTTTLMIVPVILRHKDRPDLEVFTYALLDDGSDSTFVAKSILNDLKIKGTDVALKLNTMSGQTQVSTQRIEGLTVSTYDKKMTIELPKAYSRAAIPFLADHIPSPKVADQWSHLRRIKEQIPMVKENVQVGLLIGCNCPKALRPLDVIVGDDDDDPYAIKTALGWGIIGPIKSDRPEGEEYITTCNRIITREIGGKTSKTNFVVNYQAKEILTSGDVLKMFELDFSEYDQQPFSQDDKRFIEIVERSTHFEDGHYSVSLPLKNSNVKFPNNRTNAFRRMHSLKKRFDTDEIYRQHYTEFMNKIFEKGYAEEVPSHALQTAREKSVFYINHHGVYNEKKGNKIRVVFNCSEQFEGQSLNSHLQQGPDLTNTLIGVLCRFRRAPVAFMADIESMFYQVKVPEQDRDLLRFFWWEGGDTSKNPKEYRMTVHIFGATSSPGCSNFALKVTANDNEQELGSTAAAFLRRDFYVDDGLKSVESVGEAVDLIENVKEMCKRDGFNLHKFSSNSKQVLQRIQQEDRTELIKSLDLGHDTLPTERALGVQWCTEKDAFQFVISLKDKPCTRRGILSTLSTIFDPLGFIAPVLLNGKAILQELCSNNIGWDEPVSEEVRDQWLRWKRELVKIEHLSIPRCYRPTDFGRPVETVLHHFSDASFQGYGQCSFLRMVNAEGKVHCSFVIGKSRVAPIKSITVPRLELTAAVLSVRVSEQLKKELDIKLSGEVFWTDSKVVLGYIGNSVRRFHVYVANRIQEIQEKSSITQWRYVNTKANPADEASKGLRAHELKMSKWICGPAFLWKDEKEWPVSESEEFEELKYDDPEVKKIVIMTTSASPMWPSLIERLAYFSDWLRAKKAVSLCRPFVSKLRARVQQRSAHYLKNSDVSQFKPATVQEMCEAESVILKATQQEAKLNTIMSSSLRQLDPYTDVHGIIRVGGRLKFSSLPDEYTHPAILPKSSHVTELILQYYHNKVNHQGRGITINELRANGFWVLGASALVARLIRKCVICNKLRAKTQKQRMSDLPEDRVEPSPPFLYSAVDYFGPYIIKERRKEIKRFGVLFTCMASRAIHLEVANTLDTNSFICALRRFICRRGPIRQLRSDQGSNFVGAKRELLNALEELDQLKIVRELQSHDCDWFSFRMNTPSASHMGGVWERQIRSARNVLNTLLEKNGAQLDDEALRTLFCEAEAIVNSRPLTVDSLVEPLSPNPLTPNHLLTLKTKVVLPPPGIFQDADIYSRKRWRRVQHLANEFWIRWKKEYLLSLQKRQKWLKVHRNMRVGDIVIIKDDEFVPRNKWPLARVTDTFPSADGYVRNVKLALADKKLDSDGKRINSLRYLDRPVQKIVLLQPSET